MARKIKRERERRTRKIKWALFSEM
jgi:hypothetical protein